MTDSQRIVLELTGPLERAVGQEEVAIPWSGEGRLGDLLKQFCEAHPAASEWLDADGGLTRPDAEFPAGFLVIRDSAALSASLETSVTAGERLTLMPLISGG